MHKGILLAASVVLVLSAEPGVSQTSTSPQLWTHTFPGQSSPSMFGYGSPPVGRGPAFSYSTTAKDEATLQAIVTMTQPFLGRSQGGNDGQNAYSQPFTTSDPYQGAFGTAPGWSAPFDAKPSTSSHQAPVPRPRGVFMP